MKTLKTIIAITVLSLFSISCSKDDDSKDEIKEDLSYSNGNLTTGSTAANGTIAPVGYTWSEMQGNNKTLGFTANDTYFLADDFIVPAGEKWNISKINFYIYKTDYAGAESPVKDVKYEIYSSNPSLPGAMKIYGDLSVNKYVSDADAKMYRISADFPNKTSRKIFKITASAIDLELQPGTYWIKWQTKTVDNTIHYHPSNTIIGSLDLPAYNALQQAAGVWSAVKDGTSASKTDFPFELTGTKTKI